MIKLTSKQKEVIRKIIYAVESGGQVYGKQDYTAFIDAGANTPNEVAITIGAGQWYGVEAKQLLDLIRSKNKNEFDKLDTQGIGKDLDTKDWNTYTASKTSDKAKCIIKIMTTDTGIKCQDELMELQITTYAEDIQKKYGEMSADAIAECINIKHQGGDGALKRILAKVNKPYSAKSIKAALDLDPNDKSNNNQVGDYTLRQTKVYNMIVDYLIPTMEVNTTTTTTNNGGKTNMNENELRSKVANYLTQYVGIAEGSAAHLKIINTFNNSKLCRRYKMTYKDAWCATGVSTTFIDLGLAGKSGSGKLFECCECSCGYMVDLAQKQGIWEEKDNYVPKVGDIVMYYWKDSGSGDCTGWPDHVGIVYYVNGNTSFKVIECNINNSVGYRTLAVNGKYIRGFIKPNYAKFATSVVTENNTSADVKSPVTTTLNKACKFKGTVTSKELNVRTWAGTEYDILRVIAKGTKVEVCDTIKDKYSDDWYYIKESGKYGFVSADYITQSKTTTTSTNTTINKTCKFEGKVVANSGLRVRTWAGTEYDTIKVLAKDTKVEVCDEIKSSTGKLWYYIKESGKYGFVSSDYIARI